MTTEPVRYEDGVPHQSHRWVNERESGRGICGDCGVDIEDDEALEACLSPEAPMAAERGPERVERARLPDDLEARLSQVISAVTRSAVADQRIHRPEESTDELVEEITRRIMASALVQRIIRADLASSGEEPEDVRDALEALAVEDNDGEPVCAYCTAEWSTDPGDHELGCAFHTIRRALSGGGWRRAQEPTEPGWYWLDSWGGELAIMRFHVGPDGCLWDDDGAVAMDEMGCRVYGPLPTPPTEETEES